MSAAKEILQKILESPKPSLVVFDLDSTLYNVTGRSQQILRDFAADPHFQKTYPQECEKLAKITTEHRDWGIRKALIRGDLRSSLEFFEDVRNYWRQHFFSDEYLKSDVPYEGAVDYVNAVANAGIKVKYLTGRYQNQMRVGSIESLKKWGFPCENFDEDLIMKAEPGIDDALYKREHLQRLEKEFACVWFIDNEPVILNDTIEHCPGIRLVFMDSVHSGREEPPNDISTISMSFNF